LATEAVVAATKAVAAEAATKAVAAEASETEAVTVADTKVAAEAATKVAAVVASETESAIKAAAVADFVTVAATKAAAVAAAFVTVAATKAEQEQDRAIKVRTVAVLRATVAVEVHGPSVKNRPIGLKVAEVKIAQVPSTAVQAIPSVVLQASHA
jgi:hypothetical protein